LIALSTIDAPDAVSALNLTASGAYVQAELQQVINKLNALITAVEQLRLAMSFIADSAETNVTTEV